EMDLPDPEEVLADPDAFVLPHRGDRVYAVVSAVAAAVAAKPTPERWLAGWRILGKVGEQAPDVAAVAARVLAQCRPKGVTAPPEVKLFMPVLKAAGLLT
ncbi:MAG: AAA family ATPase, partial [Acidimicrobiales bacterium]